MRLFIILVAMLLSMIVLNGCSDIDGPDASTSILWDFSNFEGNVDMEAHPGDMMFMVTYEELKARNIVIRICPSAEFNFNKDDNDDTTIEVTWDELKAMYRNPS